MKTVRKIFAMFLVLILATSALTACGSKDAAATSAGQTTEYIEYGGEGQTQGGIKSDEELAALAEEAQVNTDDATSEIQEAGEAANVDMAGHEPQSSGNFQDYWQGEDYFDIEGYLRDIGCKDFYGARIGSDERLSSDVTPEMYIAYYKDWVIFIMPASFCDTYHITNSGHRDINFTFSSNPDLDDITVSINTRGTTTTMGIIQRLQTIIDSIDLCADPNTLMDIVYAQ